jgi:methionyl-tRNA formyltransferase
MLMDAGMDTGPVLSQRRCPIADSDTTGTLTEKLAYIGAQLLVETLAAWLCGGVDPQPQDDQLATYAPMVRKEARDIDWSLPAAQLARRVRAHVPWPGSMTHWQGTALKILRARPIAHPLSAPEPGRVVARADEIAVQTGSGLLILEEVQLAGRRAMSAADFARGQRGFVGSLLGDA